MHSDEILWDGMRRGDENMFLSLYKRYYHTLLSLGNRKTNEVGPVRDLIHQLFLYLWENRHDIHSEKNVKSYLVTSFLRKFASGDKKSCNVSGLKIIAFNSFRDSLPAPEDEFVRKERCQLTTYLAADILKLPCRLRELLYLKFYEGYSYEEIVRQTGLSRRIVYDKISEALKKICYSFDNQMSLQP